MPIVRPEQKDGTCRDCTVSKYIRPRTIHIGRSALSLTEDEYECQHDDKAVRDERSQPAMQRVFPCKYHIPEKS